MSTVVALASGAFAAVSAVWAGIAAYSGPDDMANDDRFWRGVEFWTYAGAAVLFAGLWKWFSA